MPPSTLAKLARRLNRRRGARRRARLPALILMTDERRLADPTRAVQRLPPGSAVILRHYGTPGREQLVRRLKVYCRAHGLKLLIAADPLAADERLAGRLAARVGADGVHLPERLVRRARLRRFGWLVTAAAHGCRGLWIAARAGADAALLSPVFPSESHPGARVLGPLRFAAAARRSPLPVYALGGVTCRTARRLVHSGAAGLAGIGFADGCGT